MKKYILLSLLGIFLTIARTSSAQLVLNNFTDYTTGADFTFGAWTPVQGSGTMDITSGAGDGNYIWGFNTGQNYSAYTQVELDGLVNLGNVSSFYTFALIDSSFNTIASAQFTAAELTGVNVVKSLNIFLPLQMSSVEGWLLTGDGNPSNATRISFDSVALSAIPEPSTYALLMLGAGAIGVMVRRRRKA